MILTATINEVKRRILFDNPQAVVAVKGDYEVNGIAFAFPAIYEDDFDLSTAVKTVYYKATDGIVYNHVVTDTDTDTGYPLWVFKDEINKGAYGDVEFALVCDKVEGGNIVKRWVSMITAFRVQKSIEIDESEQEENEQTYSERLAYLMTQMANMQATVSGLASGAPTAVSLASGMTDTNKLYVYTGSESGYTTGHWYYYNGSAWADGGLYGGTSVDATLTVSGAAADAKVTGDKIAEIKEDLSAIGKTTLRKTNIIWFVGKSVDSSGTIQNNTSAALSNVISVSEGTRIKRVGASADSENRNLTMYVNAYENMVFKSRSILGKDTIYTVPSDVNALCFGFARAGSYGVDMTAEDIASYFAVEWHFATESSTDAEQTRNNGEYLDNLLEKFCTFGSGSSNGITYGLIDSEAHSYYVHGSTSDNISIFNLYNGLLPGCLERGKTYSILYENTAEARNCYARFIFYDKDGNVTQPEAFGYPYAVTIPDSACTVIFRLYVGKNQTVDTTIKFLKLVEVQEQRMTVPYIISFVDDDASATTYVERYYNSCKRNGINGNYAVITNKFESGATDPDMLLGYEDDGMAMLIHCSEQSYSVAPEWMDRNYDGCRKNLFKGMRAMQEKGFVNYRYWVMPYGYVNDDFKQLAVDAGMECMISSANFTYNNMAHFDRYHIKRYSLNPADLEGSKGNLAAIKTAIDEMQNLPSCWMIITTHFNEWDNVTWDSTVDATGYPVGYERMNEVIQYAKASGAAILTVPEAWRFYEPIIEANEQRYNKIKP